MKKLLMLVVTVMLGASLAVAQTGSSGSTSSSTDKTTQTTKTTTKKTAKKSGAKKDKAAKTPKKADASSK
jgi:hypothetical protein